MAGLVGLAVGIEREWSGHASGPAARFAGARTFLLLGLLGGAAGLLLDAGHELSAAALLLGAAALAVGAYVVVARRGVEDATDGTTEAAALAVLGLAALAGIGLLPLAAGAGAVMVLALREKGSIHRFVRALDEVELRAALQFAVLALVLLPLLPVGPFGPLGGIRPRELWIVVLLVSGLNFAGWVARRVVGVRRGTAVAGLLGGLISSTAVTLSFARQSRDRPADARALALGAVGACTVLLPRLLALTLALRPGLTQTLLPYFAPPLAVGLGLLGLGFGRSPPEETPSDPAPQHANPLRLGTAVLLALGFQAVLMVMAGVHAAFGNPGVLASAGLLGLTDMDALTLAMTRLASEADRVPLAALAMAVGVLANTLLKLIVALALGSGGFRRAAGGGLLLLGLASAGGIWLGAR